MRNVTRKLAMTLVLTIGSMMSLAASSSSATAGDCYASNYYWRTVTVWVTVEKPCTRSEVRYDHCGKPYLVSVTSVEQVRVPVQKRVKVYY